MTDASPPVFRVSTSMSNGLQSEPNQKATIPVSSSKSSTTRDEDWGSISKGTTTPSVPLEPNPQPIQPMPISQPSTVTASSTVSHQSSSFTPVNIEWPPPISSTTLTSQLNTNEKQAQNSGGLSEGSFDDLDHFANWPPKPSGAVGLGNSSTNGLGFVSNNNPNGLSNSYEGSSVSGTNKAIGANLYIHQVAQIQTH